MTLRQATTAMIAHAALAPELDPMAMPQTVPWTRKDLDRLPDDGNRYEVVDGELLVTPPPSVEHQAVVEWLAARLFPFVLANELGTLGFPRSVIVEGGEQVEPDLMVRQQLRGGSWERAPLPILVIEVISEATRRRDLENKRDFYMRAGIPEYWAVDRRRRSIVRFTAAASETVQSVLTWAPKGITEKLEIDVAAMFAVLSQPPGR
jgi:Uma2 family endonuclease